MPTQNTMELSFPHNTFVFILQKYAFVLKNKLSPLLSQSLLLFKCVLWPKGATFDDLVSTLANHCLFTTQEECSSRAYNDYIYVRNSLCRALSSQVWTNLESRHKDTFPSCVETLMWKQTLAWIARKMLYITQILYKRKIVYSTQQYLESNYVDAQHFR